MKGNPKTKEEAQVTRYGCWAGYPNGRPFDEKICAAHIFGYGRGALPTQCGKAPGHGPDKLYCKGHAEEFFPEGCEIWYETGSQYFWDIKEVRVSSSTEKFVCVLNDEGTTRRESKESEYSRYWPTRKQAADFLRQRAENQLKSAQKLVEDLTKILENLK